MKFLAVTLFAAALFVSALSMPAHHDEPIQWLSCIIGVATPVSEKYGLQILWKESNAVIQNHIVNLYDCEQRIPTPDMIRRCQNQEMYSAVHSIDMFLNRLQSAIPAAAKEVREGMVVRCSEY